MRMMTAVVACFLLTAGAGRCTDPDAEQLRGEVSKLADRLSKTEDALQALSTVLVRCGYSTSPEKPEQAAVRLRTRREQPAEFEAMTVDQLEDLILDLEDQVAQAMNEEREARKLMPSAGRPRTPGGDRQERKAELRIQFAAGRACSQAREKGRAAQSRLDLVRSVWVEKAFGPSGTEAPAPEKD